MNERGNYASSSVLYFFPAVFTGEADVLLNMCKPHGHAVSSSLYKPDMNKLNAFIKAGAPIRTVVRSQRERQRTVRGRCESVMEAQIDGICIEIPDVG